MSKFHKFHRKRPVLESLFNKVASLQAYTLEMPTQVFSSETCNYFKSTYFKEHLQTTASDRIYIFIQVVDMPLKNVLVNFVFLSDILFMTYLKFTDKNINEFGFCFYKASVCACACACVCVCAHPFTVKASSVLVIWNAREQNNHIAMKTFLSHAKSLHH